MKILSSTFLPLFFLFSSSFLLLFLLFYFVPLFIFFFLFSSSFPPLFLLFSSFPPIFLVFSSSSSFLLPSILSPLLSFPSPSFPLFSLLIPSLYSPTFFSLFFPRFSSLSGGFSSLPFAALASWQFPAPPQGVLPKFNLSVCAQQSLAPSLHSCWHVLAPPAATQGCISGFHSSYHRVKGKYMSSQFLIPFFFPLL